MFKIHKSKILKFIFQWLLGTRETRTSGRPIGKTPTAPTRFPPMLQSFIYYNIKCDD